MGHRTFETPHETSFGTCWPKVNVPTGRMLIYAPNTPRLELGILYYRLGAYDVARSYFGQALANPSIPPSVAAQVRLYL
jgi:hypothetical protein